MDTTIVHYIKTLGIVQDFGASGFNANLKLIKKNDTDLSLNIM